MMEKFFVTATDGQQLHCYLWPATQVRAIVALVHGFGEHAARYQHVADYFNAQGISLLAMDMRGHGYSGGKRGDIPSYDQMMEDIELLLRETRVRALDIPLFLMGHSWGGGLVLNFAMRRKMKEVKGVISTSPWLRLAFQPPKWKEKASELMINIWPSLTLANELDTGELSKDPEVKRAYDQDPLTVGVISPRLYIQTRDAGEWVLNNADKVDFPLLLVHGDIDKITDHQASQLLANTIRTQDATLKIWPNCKHETHNETEKGEVIAYLSQWISDRI